MSLSKKILNMFGWTVDITVPDFPKAIICVAPHTSNWDFIIGKLSYASVHRKAGFLMKESWFFPPLGWIFKAMGGIPVPRKKKKVSLVDSVVNKFNESKRMVIAITPEGTRSKTDKWHTGFLYIARRANVPVLLGIIDFKQKKVIINKVFDLTSDIDADMRSIKDYYKGFSGKYPEKFSTD